MKNKDGITIEELREMDLPVKLACLDGWFNNGLKTIEVKYIGDTQLFIKNNNGFEFSINILDLKHYKIAPKTKIIEVNETYYSDSSGTISEHKMYGYIYPIHINQTLEVCEETGKVLSVEVHK